MPSLPSSGVLKGLAQPYLPGKRARIKVRSRIASEVVIGAVAGSPKSPLTIPSGRYDDSGDLRLVARTAVLNTAVRRELDHRLVPSGSEHPWRGRHFSAGWGASGELEFRTVRPELVAEFVSGTAVDASRYRHPVRFVRIRADRALHKRRGSRG